MTDTITITGNIATEPERKRTTAGVSITSFRLASGQRRFDRSANAWVDTGTNFYSVSAFRGMADHAFDSLHKGDRVLLTGRLRIRDWDNGTKHGTDVEIEVDAIGHDLRWGTTTFVKDAAPADREATWQVPEAPGDAWVAPGTEAEGATEADAEPARDPMEAEARPLELSGIQAPF